MDIKDDLLGLLYLKCDPQTSNTCLTGEVLRQADSGPTLD